MLRIAPWFVCLAGCIASVGRGPAPVFVASASSSPRSVAPADPDDRPMGRARRFLSPDQFRALFGKSTSEARRLLAGWGHTGAVEIVDGVFEGCGLGVVCQVGDVSAADAPRFAAKTDADTTLTLWVNRTVKLAAPPPE